jgi:transposase InsO family protein
MREVTASMAGCKWALRDAVRARGDLVNSPEFIAKAIRRHGKHGPWENGYAESFFSRLRDELLNCEEFANLSEARWFAQRRLHEHNEERPHSSLGYMTPSAFAAACANSVRATPSLRPHTRKPEEVTISVSQPVLS